MGLDEFYFLLSEEGQRGLDETAAAGLTSESHLPLAERLRREVGPEKAHAILETTLLRQLAAAKFSRAAQMYFTRPALEQASAEVISRYRAGRYAAAGLGRIADLGCGIGGDSLALAEQADVIGVDWDGLRLAMAQENVRVYGQATRFHPLQADLLELTPLPVQALFADPSRRDEAGRRFYSVHDYQPPLDFLDRWRLWVPYMGIKISPGVEYAELPAEAEVEFISVDGEVREGVLWFGELRSGAGRRATLLPGGHTLADEPVGHVAVTRPQAYLYEPDGAVIRAHLVEQLAGRLGATKIDEDIAYLTAGAPQETVFARCYALEDAFPFQLKRLRHYLQQRHVGQVTIKKRGSPLDPDELRQRLRLQGDEHRVIFLTHVQGEATVLIGRDYKP
ncbi:MAG: SAM-dependent methyltransferase [Chloroflexi bacterium]|nr:SAM-dependent methyltransferase [Chloroflexota bacterium]MCI0578316.1 SAM-dependent methyltransferase [Chloroflexota bacterium]MCI0649016.1 SAM-dependent methyltransferase [Chloroflexota bacterium]MCI0729451.1 SAM-dependent methyltransferase [Chloroflexota bacterium]